MLANTLYCIENLMITMDKKIIVANWKMNKTLPEAIETAKQLRGSHKLDIVIAPPNVALATLSRILSPKSIKLAAQNTHFADRGNFTGEISPPMLKSCGCSYVMIGHHERRSQFKEDEDTINSKILVSLSYKLKVILCVGETTTAVKNNIGIEYIAMQLARNLYKVRNFKDVIIVYQPVWAIKSELDVDLEYISQIAKYIKTFVRKNFVASVKVLYGGEVNQANCKRILDLEYLDGAMVENHSLDPKLFNKIIKVIITNQTKAT